jgi:hypothetical protein
MPPSSSTTIPAQPPPARWLALTPYRSIRPLPRRSHELRAAHPDGSCGSIAVPYEQDNGATLLSTSACPAIEPSLCFISRPREGLFGRHQLSDPPDFFHHIRILTSPHQHRHLPRRCPQIHGDGRDGSHHLPVEYLPPHLR